MYGLNGSVDLGFLVGKALLQIKAGQSQLILCFDHDTEICVESSFSVNTNGADTKVAVANNNYMNSIGPLYLFFGREIASVGNNGDGSLSLVFAGDTAIIKLLDSNTDYESYQISCGDLLIVV